MPITPPALPFLIELAGRLDTNPSARVSAQDIGKVLGINDDTQLHQVLGRLRRKGLVEFPAGPKPRLGDNNLIRPLAITAAGKHARRRLR